MAVVRKRLSTKRFGARYGRKIREKAAKIEANKRKEKKCPYCRAMKVKRLSTGIWYCGKCGAKFTGRAYTMSAKVIVKAEELEEDASLKKEGE